MSRQCHSVGCTRRPCFNYQGSQPGVFCGQHAKASMVDVVNIRCAFGEGCVTYPKFNHSWEESGVFCRQHAEESMVDVMSRRCACTEGCMRQPTFNHEGRQAAFCKIHAEDSMVDVAHKRCAHSEGCTSRPSWGYWADGKGTFCDKHKGDLADGRLAINFNQRCKAAGHKECGKIAKWGTDGEQPTHCDKHGASRAGEGFVQIPSRRRAEANALLVPKCEVEVSL